MTLPWMKCPTTELSLLLPVQGHISLSWRNLSKRKVQRRMSRSILLSRHFVVKPVETLFQSTNVCPTIECSTSRTLAARASFKLLSTRFENFHSEWFFCMSVIRKESYAYSIERDQLTAISGHILLALQGALIVAMMFIPFLCICFVAKCLWG